MELTIELTNRYIEITEKKISAGKITIEKYVRSKMPEGAFQNGIVINTNAVALEIREMLKAQQISGKRTVLCISGMDIIRKEVNIPKSKEKYVRGLIENELHKADVLRKGYIFDYIPDEHAEKGFWSYQVYILPEDLIGNYQTTLKRAGLNLMRVIPVARSMEALAKLNGLHKQKELSILVNAESTHINLLMAGEGIKSIHRMIEIKEEEDIEENIFIVSAVRQLKDTISPESRVMESLVENISRLFQFQSQTYKGRSIGEIIIYGEMTSTENFVNDLEQRTGIPVKLCSVSESKLGFCNIGMESDFHGYNGICMTAGRSSGQRKELSFVNIPGSSSYVSPRDYLPAFIGLSCIFVLALFYGYTSYSNLRTEKRIEDLSEEITKIENNKDYQEKHELEEELGSLNSYNENCRICIGLIESRSRLKPELFAEVDQLLPPNVSIQTYGFENHKVLFGCISAYQDGPADFARIVTDAKLFKSVKYTGFQAFSDISGATYYNFQLECGE